MNWVIEAISGKGNRSDYVAVRKGASAETNEVQEVPLSCLGRKFILVDTPGFGHTDMSDADVLETVTTWMKNS